MATARATRHSVVLVNIYIYNEVGRAAVYYITIYTHALHATTITAAKYTEVGIIADGATTAAAAAVYIGTRVPELLLPAPVRIT